MRIRIGGKSVTTKRHTRTVGGEIAARGHAAALIQRPDVLASSVSWYRSDTDRFTVQWNTIESRARLIHQTKNKHGF